MPLAEKDAARILARNFLRDVPRARQEIFVRINGLDTKYALDDLQEVLPALARRHPPAEGRQPRGRRTARHAAHRVRGAARPGDRPLPDPPVHRERRRASSTACRRRAPRAGSWRSPSAPRTTPPRWRSSAPRTGEELFSARTQVVWAAKAAGVQAIDSRLLRRQRHGRPAGARPSWSSASASPASRSSTRARSRSSTRSSGPSRRRSTTPCEVMDAIKRAREMGTGVISLRGRDGGRAGGQARGRARIRTAMAFGMIDYELSDEVIHGQE